MKQWEAVRDTLERLGGIATFAQLNQEVFKIQDCEWKSKTPFASIRGIVQRRPEFFRVRPGLWALESHRSQLVGDGIIPEEKKGSDKEDLRFTHSYYQGLIIEIGRMKHLETAVPAQDKNHLFIQRRLGEMVSLKETPQFTYPSLVRRSSTIDTIWFEHASLDNSILMPTAFFEVEHTSDIQNSLLKFLDLQYFSAHMFIVADERRKQEYLTKLSYSAFQSLKQKKQVDFISYGSILEQYNFLSRTSGVNLII